MDLSVVEVLQDARRAAADLEVDLYAGTDALKLVDELGKTKRALAAAEARAAARVVETYAFQALGYADEADWFARATGCGLGEAKSVLKTMERIDSCPATRDALAHGELSLDQAHEITLTEAECPGSEDEMLRAAKRDALKKLRERGLDKRLRHKHPDDLTSEREARKYHRHWVDRYGMVRYSGSAVPEVGVAIISRIDTETDRLVREALREKNGKTREQCAAEAFVIMCATGGKPHATKAELVLVAGVDSVRTGTVVDGEPCHLLSDYGPIPVSTELARHHLDAQDCFVKLVLHDGVHITQVKLEGRKTSAELRTALSLGDPPLFHGPECGCGCAKRKGLQRDHLNPVANGGDTSLDNIDPKCTPSHKAKTKADRAAGLLDGRAPPDLVAV